MRFLVGAHLPRRLCHQLRALGHDAVHTLDLPDGNRTSDAAINALSVEEKRVVVTNDADFVDSLIINAVPYKLLLTSTGNISNNALETLSKSHFTAILQSLEKNEFAELGRSALRVHF